jgi:hypothetical protein
VGNKKSPVNVNDRRFFTKRQVNYFFFDFVIILVVSLALLVEVFTLAQSTEEKTSVFSGQVWAFLGDLGI